MPQGLVGGEQQAEEGKENMRENGNWRNKKHTRKKGSLEKRGRKI